MIASLTLTMGLLAQASAKATPQEAQEGTPATMRSVAWKEGTPIRIRVPVATASLKLMATVAFPEERIETAVSGWGEELTAIDNGGRLFLRLSRKAEGQLGVIGGSGTHYLLYLEGIEGGEPGKYDGYLKITRETRSADPLPRRSRKRPTGSIALLQAMRLGLRPEGGKILRAGGETVYDSETLEIRLAYVYLTPDFAGYIYDLENRTEVKQAVDASRLRAKEGTMVLSSLRENVVPPHSTTRLYAILWRDSR